MTTIMDNEYVDGAGYLSLLATIFMWLANKIEHVQINEVLQGITAVLAIIFVTVKINGQILDNRQKRKNLKDGKNSEK